MNRGSVLNLPFLGQIVKVITRDGKEYEMKISEEVPNNPYIFSIMYRVNDGSNSGGYDPLTLKPNRPPPPISRDAKPTNTSGISSNKNDKSKDIKVDKKDKKDNEKNKTKQKEETKTKRRDTSDIGKIFVK